MLGEVREEGRGIHDLLGHPDASLETSPSIRAHGAARADGGGPARDRRASRKPFDRGG